MTTSTLTLRNLFCVSGAALLVTVVALMLQPSAVNATPPGAPAEAPTPTAVMPAGGTVTDAGVSDELKTTATIVIATTPATTAMVTWGRQRLGKITPGKPLVVVRPRDSGPLDVVVRATGYLAVQTRAHTFSDNRVQVKLTPLDKKSELLGYREPIDAGVDPSQAAALEAVGGDGGVPVAPTPATTPFQMVPAAPAPSPLLMP
jgi:hypothetical protein